MYEELIKALRICGSGLYPNPCPFSINERCTFGCWMDTGRKAASALETLTAQLAALQAENAQQRTALSRVETERDAAVAGLHSMHTLCMEIGESCPECGGQIDDLLDSACTFCKGSGVSCWKIDPANKNRCAAFEWRGAQGEG